MQFCKSCGLLLPQDAAVCPGCGAPCPPPVEEPKAANAAGAPAGEPQPGAQYSAAGAGTNPAQGTPAQSAPLYENDGPRTMPAPVPMEKDLSIGGFVASLLLFKLPFIGLILQIVWACGGTNNAIRKKLSIAQLIVTGIMALLTLLLVVFVVMFSVAVVNTGMLYSQPQIFYEW